MRPHQDVPKRNTHGAEVPTDADDPRQHLEPRHSQNQAAARAKRRAAALSWSIAPAAIDPILDLHPIEKAGTRLWRARRHIADGALAVAG